MSGAIGPTSNGYGALATVISNSAQVKQQLDTLTEQASNGLISDTYAGLGSGASVSLNLNPELAQLQTWQNNIGQVTGQIDVTQNAMTQLQSIAAQFAAYMPNLDGLNASEVDSIASDAQSALGQVADLLDTKDGQTYVFAGQDTSNPPVPSPDAILSSNFYTQINSAVSALASNGAAATTAATLQIASSNDSGTSPFSTYLSQPLSGISPATIDIGNGDTAQIGLLASANSAIQSTGTSTTGSYMRDLMRALATLGSMSSSQVNNAGFAALVADTQTSLTGVVNAMAGDVGVLGDRQASLATQQTDMTSMQTALTKQISNAQDADMAATLSKLTATQTQLQESYRLIDSTNAESLVNFLPAAA